jgi:hypothetical protein
MVDKLVEVVDEARIIIAPKKLVARFRVGNKWYQRTVYDWWGDGRPYVIFKGKKYIDPNEVVGL